MIKDWITQSTETDKKDKILSDRDITISYQPIQITDNISILISKMQIKDNDAKLFVSVRRNDVEKEGELPLNYKIYNLKKNILCDQNSKEDSNSKESIFEDELIIKNYSQQDTILDFEIYKPNGELLTTLYINLEDKEINVVGMGEYLEKISEIELKKFLESITELPKAGKKYKVYTDDIKIRRWIESGELKEGDLVIVEYVREISSNYEVKGAYSIFTGTLEENGILNQE